MLICVAVLYLLFYLPFRLHFVSLSYALFADALQSLKQLTRLAIRRSIRAQNLARYVPARCLFRARCKVHAVLGGEAG